MKRIKFCKFCGRLLYRNTVNEAWEYDQFTGKRKSLGYYTSLYCEQIRDCGSWNQEQRTLATSSGLYQHIFHVEGMTKSEIKKYPKR